MGRIRVTLIFGEENEKQREVCEYLKSQPRCKTALITELVYNWLHSQEGSQENVVKAPVQEKAKSRADLKAEITAEILQDQRFLALLQERLCSPSDEGHKAEAVETEQIEDGTEPDGIPMDFDEDMLLNGMAMFEV